MARHGPRPSASRAPTTRSTTCSTTRAVEVVHVTSPNDLHLPQTLAILAAGRHVVCEKPLAMSAAESRQLVEAAAASGLVNAANFNIRYYPLNQHAHEVVTGGEIGDVRLVTGRYFQDWLLLESDWNWRLQPERGGALRAVGDIGSHWLDLMTFVTGQRVVAVMAELATFIEARHEPTGPVETFSTDVAAETVDPRRSPPRTPRRSCCASRTARAARSASARSAPAGRTRSSTRSTGRRRRSPGIRSSPTRSGSATASDPTRSSSRTRR